MSGRQENRAVMLCIWCLAAVAVEVGLYASYTGHDARFHWFTHFYVGASASLLVMAALSWRTRMPVSRPLVWLLVGHLYAMTPDFLFAAGVAHQRWMDIFLGHISSHFVPGRNNTWLAVFAFSLAVYLLVIDRRVDHAAVQSLNDQVGGA